MGRLLDRLFAVSDSVRDSLIAERLMPDDKVMTLANGVEAPAWSGGRLRARRDLELPEDAPVILFLGRLVEQKEPAVLLRALSLLRSTRPDALVLLAGEGPLRGELEREAGALELGGRVQFLGNRSDVGRLLAAADVLAMPSRFEGLPLAVLEAMATGLPIVACDAPGTRDAVAHGVNGWLAQVGDAEGVARGLQLALSPSPGRQWAAASRRHYERHFTAEQMAARHDKQYTRALAVRGARSAVRGQSARHPSRVEAAGVPTAHRTPRTAHGL
jgi:glycosyltransferase involved in cell wall biosynthesis